MKTQASADAGFSLEEKLQSLSRQLTERLVSLPPPVAPLEWYSKARTAHFRAQNLLLTALYRLDPGGREMLSHMDGALRARLVEAMDELLRQDLENIRSGLYPASVLLPESPVRHMMRFPKLAWSIAETHLRRSKGKTTVFDGKARRFLDGLPRYYRRNFHWQGNGYLSEESAELYEHQVEVLFSGTSDAMRRMIIKPLKNHFKDNAEGEGLHFLEVAAGTGRTTRFVKLAFPKARITVLDLSQPYLRHARHALDGMWDLDFVQGDGARLPFAGGTFDAVYSVFLFHELPEEVRSEVIREGMRVLKPGGLYGFVDSIQKGDIPEFDVLLECFPKLYHEPFYRNYSESPMERVLEKVGMRSVNAELGFYSKLGWGLL